MVEKLTTIEIRHKNILVSDDYNYLTKLIDEGYTSGMPNRNIKSWEIKTVKVLTIDDIGKMFIENYSDELKQLKITDAHEKADHFKHKLIENYLDDFKNGDIMIDFDEDWNCGDEDVNKLFGSDFHAIVDEFTSRMLAIFENESEDD